MAFKLPSDYNTASTGEYRSLPAGGYICRIIKAEETKSKTGKDMLKIAFDICDGDFTGYFMDQFQNRKASAEDPSTVKWAFSGTKWIMILNNEGKTNTDFKAFGTALTESGCKAIDTVKMTCDASMMKDAQIGIVFRREEQEWEGKTSWRTVPFRFRSVSAIESGDYTVPDDKPLSKPATLDLTGIDSFQAAEDDIPF